MSRCIACNAILTESEMKVLEDPYCIKCTIASESEYNYSIDHEFVMDVDNPNYRKFNNIMGNFNIFQ